MVYGVLCILISKSWNNIYIQIAAYRFVPTNNKTIKKHKMKTQQIHVALLLIAMAVSAYASGQQELIQADKYQIEETRNGL